MVNFVIQTEMDYKSNIKKNKILMVPLEVLDEVFGRWPLNLAWGLSLQGKLDLVLSVPLSK